MNNLCEFDENVNCNCVEKQDIEKAKKLSSRKYMIDDSN